MKKLFIVLLAIGVVASPQISAAQSAAPTPAPTVALTETGILNAPAGWTTSPPKFTWNGFTAITMWNPPAPQSPGDSIILGYVASPAGTTLADTAQAMDATYQKLFGAANVAASRAQMVCSGNQPGWYFENKITFGTFNLVSEQTIIVGKSHLFEATYTRQSSEPEDSAARAALNSLCVKPL